MSFDHIEIVERLQFAPQWMRAMFNCQLLTIRRKFFYLPSQMHQLEIMG